MPPSSMDNVETLKVTKDASSSKDTTEASQMGEGLEKTGLMCTTDAEHQQDTHSHKAIQYPGGLKLFVQALVAPFIPANLSGDGQITERSKGSHFASQSFSLR